jgi:hypothetical protein
MSLSDRRNAIRRITRIIAGLVGLLYGILYFFPSLKQTDYWYSRHLLLLVVIGVIWWGHWKDRRLVEWDKKRKRDSLPLN